MRGDGYCAPPALVPAAAAVWTWRQALQPNVLSLTFPPMPQQGRQEGANHQQRCQPGSRY